jgi:hypothetical protein
MGSSTFSGPVRSENGFQTITKNADTGAITVTSDTSNALMTAGTGITTGTGTVYHAGVQRDGGMIKTTIFTDLTGLNSQATDLDIIGVDGGTANCHFGQITAAINGTIVGIRMTCLELPAGGDPNIALYSATEATGAEDALITSLTETLLLDPAADWANGTVLGGVTMPAADEYLYLVQGDATGTNGTYTAGKFVIELIGTPV